MNENDKVAAGCARNILVVLVAIILAFLLSPEAGIGAIQGATVGVVVLLVIALIAIASGGA